LQPYFFEVKKQQLILSVSGIVLLLLLWFFGKTVADKTDKPASQQAGNNEKPAFDIDSYLKASKQKLNINQANYVNELENSVSRGDVKSQQEKAYTQLANFWHDSLDNHELYVFYISKAAMLVNSEKNLTFAAQLFLNNLRREQDDAKLNWQCDQAIELFEKAIALNPNNEDLRIGLGSCYVFGKGRNGDPQQTMKGIQELLGVVRRDSNNMKAQLVLGVGGSISGQYDKAIERLKKVVEKEPGNVEAIAFLADSYAGKGEKAEAIKWYTISKRLVNDPHYSKEVDERIRMLQK